MSYICISKTKLEERIKYLSQWNESNNYEIKTDSGSSSKHPKNVDTEIRVLQELLKESIDAEEVFNAGREIISDWKDEGFYDLDDEGMQYNPKFKNNYSEYSKTLNI